MVAGEAATGDEAVGGSSRRCDPMWFSSTWTCPGPTASTQRARSSTTAPAGETRVVMLMTAESDDAVFGALRAGATGLLLKDADPDDLVAAVRVVARGEAAARAGRWRAGSSPTS